MHRVHQHWKGKKSKAKWPTVMPVGLVMQRSAPAADHEVEDTEGQDWKRERHNESGVAILVGMKTFQRRWKPKKSMSFGKVVAQVCIDPDHLQG